MNYLLFSLAEVPWSWTKIKFWDVSIWIKIWKEEIERWVRSGNAIVTADKLRNVNTAHVRALETVFGSMFYTCRADGGRHTFFIFPAFHTTLEECCGLCTSQRGDICKFVPCHGTWLARGRWVLVFFFYKDLLGDWVDEQCTVPSLKQFIKKARSKLVWRSDTVFWWWNVLMAMAWIFPSMRGRKKRKLQRCTLRAPQKLLMRTLTLEEKPEAT